jgi:hypothetical protein
MRERSALWRRGVEEAATFPTFVESGHDLARISFRALASSLSETFTAVSSGRGMEPTFLEMERGVVHRSSAVASSDRGACDEQHQTAGQQQPCGRLRGDEGIRPLAKRDRSAYETHLYA